MGVRTDRDSALDKAAEALVDAGKADRVDMMEAKIQLAQAWMTYAKQVEEPEE